MATSNTSPVHLQQCFTNNKVESKCAGQLYNTPASLRGPVGPMSAKPFWWEPGISFSAAT